jgi:uncharacterized protein YutE (UPF0331/DUF86 family)
MNERIKQLIEQSYDEVPHERDWDAVTRVFNKEKFAELIVGKCIDICKEQATLVSTKYGPARLNMSFMANDCAQAIKEHFKE